MFAVTTFVEKITMISFFAGNNPHWTQFVKDTVPAWKSYIKALVLYEVKHPVLVVHYEDLQKDTVHEVSKN